MYLAGGGVLTLESLLIRLEIEPLRREKMMMMAQFYPENLWPPASVPRYLNPILSTAALETDYQRSDSTKAADNFSC